MIATHAAPRRRTAPKRPLRIYEPGRVGDSADSTFLAAWLTDQARRHRLLLATVAAAPAAPRPDPSRTRNSHAPKPHGGAPMLVLSRKPDQRFLIGDDIVITVLRVDGDKVRIGIEAPPQVRVLRQELVDAGTDRIDRIIALHDEPLAGRDDTDGLDRPMRAGAWAGRGPAGASLPRK
jgi:carbon storage regulator